MKKHKHDWGLADEQCHSCGAYTEYCRVKDCTAVRYCEANGKVVDQED